MGWWPSNLQRAKHNMDRACASGSDDGSEWN